MDRLTGKMCRRAERDSEQRQANETTSGTVIISEHSLHTYYVSGTLKVFHVWE